MNLLQRILNGRMKVELPTCIDYWCNTLIEKKKYADAYLWMIFSLIFSALKNVKYETKFDYNNDHDSLNRVKQLFNYIEMNLPFIMFLLWEKGYILFNKTETSIELVNPNKQPINLLCLRNYDGIGYFSNEFLMENTSKRQMLAQHITDLDDLSNGNSYLTKSLGAFAVISGATMPMADEDRERLLEGIKREIGITDKKFQFKITNKPISVQQIDFKIRELDLDNKIKNDLMLLAGSFGVPYDLIPFSGKSTFANQQEATKNFYHNCIAPMAEIGLDIIKQAVKRDAKIYIPVDDLTFDFDNVPELKTDKEKEIDRLMKVATVMEKVKAAGGDYSGYMKELENYGKD